MNLTQLNKDAHRGARRQLLLILSLFVVLGVFWCLKLTGITMAGGAFCGMEEHRHGDRCPVGRLICGQKENPGHTHDESCILRELICGQEEGIPPVSGEENAEAGEGHIHTEECYYIGVGFGCGMTEEEGHVHTEDCLTQETELGCGQVCVPAHTHTEDCYEALAQCPLEEHIHVESCYSDISADIETEADWEDSLQSVAEETSTAKMLVAVARSQLGQAESTLNFEVDRQGIRRGIVRYGQWYGNPYGDWSAMFAAFCLHYAGAEDLPTNAGPESMRLEWEKAGLYRPADTRAPQAGDLVFLSHEANTEEAGEADAEVPEFVPAYLSENDAASAVAIIADVTEENITVIQGDLEDAVSERTLEADDPAILGYGLVPESSPYALRAAAAAADDMTYLARTINYANNMFTNGRSFVLYTERNGVYYAIDGNARAVPIKIDGNGGIYTDVAAPDTLLWTFTPSGNRYVIANVGTGLYLHPFYNGANDNGIINRTGWDTPLTPSGRGVKIIHSASARLNANATAYEITRNQNEASVFYFGVAERHTVHLDGTNGNLMSLGGSDVDSRSVAKGSTITLPSQWKSPEKYSYVLKGWYDVGNRRYYDPGAEVTVTENMLFYADWAAATYDIGQMNEDVVDTVSTNEFITTNVFDYNSLFNTLSMNNNYTGGSSTRWTLVEEGTVQTTGEETLNFVFIDYDDPGNPGAISYPIGRNQANGVDYSRVTFGLYNDELAELLFDTDLEVAGKHHLGQGDHLFQYGDDPSDPEHYGYYYYDSILNAASYHQSNGRFYVYDYLERTADSANNGSYSDFLPLNSPYANTNGKATGTYTYNGVHNEYVGTPHISYDSKYSDNNNSTNRIVTNYWFGMSIEMDFYLPAVPGTVDSDGVLANQSITGDDMVFEFSGDDDVWVLIDGELVLDIGGIHGVEAGSIDFSTGDVIVDGVKTGTVTGLSSGSHTLTMYYLERGSSLSNFKLRFNLSTRYSMNLRKEDTLTAHLLDGAQFAVYTDEACTRLAELWPSRDAHEDGEPATNVFTVEDGVASMWGLAAGNTYWLEEVRGPDALNGAAPKGLIRMRLNNRGLPDYEITADSHGELTVGYTVHGYKVNEDTQEAYLVITNTDAVDSEPTEVYVEKVWSDRVDHSSDSVTVYLLANGVRIQSMELSELNDWKHIWENLPKTDANGDPVVYTVREATVPGYVDRIEAIQLSGSGGSITGGGTPSGPGGRPGGRPRMAARAAADGFTDGETYLLHTRFGYIGASGNKVQLESSQDNARNSDNTQWVAEVHGDGRVTLKNKAGQTLYYDNYTFRASSSPGQYRNLNYADGKLYCFIDHGSWSETQYPVDNDSVANNVTYNGVFYTTNTSAQAMTITLEVLGGGGTTEPEEPVEPEKPVEPDEPELSGDETAYRITNTPIGDAAISLRVKKVWDLGNLGDPSQYEEKSVHMRLLADGEDAGLTATLNLRNGWSYTFESLPKYRDNGQEIVYAVEEVELPDGWRVQYGPVTPVGNSETAYETIVTNVHHETIELPSTGSFGRYGYIMLGLLIMVSSLGWYSGQRRRCERGERR